MMGYITRAVHQVPLMSNKPSYPQAPPPPPLHSPYQQPPPLHSPYQHPTPTNTPSPHPYSPQGFYPQPQYSPYQQQLPYQQQPPYPMYQPPQTVLIPEEPSFCAEVCTIVIIRIVVSLVVLFILGVVVI